VIVCNNIFNLKYINLDFTVGGCFRRSPPAATGVIFGGHRPPLQVLFCKITLKLQIHAVATGVDRRK